MNALWPKTSVEKAVIQGRFFDKKENRFPQEQLLQPLLAQQIEFTQMMQLLNLPRKSTLIDFGSGSGRTSLYFLRQGYHVIAIDVSEQSLRSLRHVYNTYRTPSWGILKTTTKLSAAKPADGIVGTDVLHHVDMGYLLPQLLSKLKAEGHIVFSEPNAWYLLWYVHFLREHIPWNIERGILQCSWTNIHSALKHSGFSHIRLVGHGLLPTRFLNNSPALCQFNALIMGNLPVLKLFAFRFMICARK